MDKILEVVNKILETLINGYSQQPVSITILLFIFLLFYIVKKGTEGAIKNDTNFLEFYLNGLTPKKLRKKKNHNRRSEDDFEQKIVNK